MLSWSLTFFVLAVMAAVLGFSGIAAAATSIAKILFFIFLVLFVSTFFFKAARAVDDEVERNIPG